MDEARAAGAWVKSQRLAAGMTQEELAGKSGLSVRAISNLERGRTARPHPRSLEVLAVALGLPETAGTEWAARLRAGHARDASSDAPQQPPAVDEQRSQPDAADPGLPEDDAPASPEAAVATPAEPWLPRAHAAEHGTDVPRQSRRATRLRAARRVRIGVAPLLLIVAIIAVVAALTDSKSPGTEAHTLGSNSLAGRPPALSASPAVMLGTWTSAEGDGGYSTVAGQHPNVANTYLFWGHNFPTSFASQAQSAGATPFVEIEPWQGGGPSDCDYTTNFPAMTTIGANGAAISRYLSAFGSAIAAFGHPVIVTFAHEFNVSGQYPWAQGDCEGTTPTQWIKAWDTVRSDIDSTADGLAHFMWAPGADTGGTTSDPTPYWPGSSQVDMVAVEGFPDTQWGSQFGTFSGLFGPVFDEIHALTSLPIFIAETDLAPLDGKGYQSIPGFISDLCSSGGDGVLQFQDAQTLSGKQWNELDMALAGDCGTRAAGGG